MKRVKSAGWKQRLVVLALLLMVASLVWGVGSAFSASSSPSPDSGKVIVRVGWASEPDSLNPFVQGLIAAFVIDHLNYDLLFGYKADDFSPTPELAAEIPTQENGGISADGKTWTVKLRQGVKWQDGEPFTASDVAFTYMYIIDNDLSTFAMFTKDIKSVDGRGRLHRRVQAHAPQEQLPRHVGADRPGAHLEGRPARAGGRQVSRTIRRSSAPARSR